MSSEPSQFRFNFNTIGPLVPFVATPVPPPSNQQTVPDCDMTDAPPAIITPPMRPTASTALVPASAFAQLARSTSALPVIATTAIAATVLPTSQPPLRLQAQGAAVNGDSTVERVASSSASNSASVSSNASSNAPSNAPPKKTALANCKEPGCGKPIYYQKQLEKQLCTDCNSRISQKASRERHDQEVQRNISTFCGPTFMGRLNGLQEGLAKRSRAEHAILDAHVKVTGKVKSVVNYSLRRKESSYKKNKKVRDNVKSTDMEELRGIDPDLAGEFQEKYVDKLPREHNSNGEDAS